MRDHVVTSYGSNAIALSIVMEWPAFSAHTIEVKLGAFNQINNVDTTIVATEFRK